MAAGERRYVPAAGHRFLTGVYDPVLALTMRERRFRERLARELFAGLGPGEASVVDVGCGTGSFAIALAARAPGIELIGVDGDADVLARASAKPGAERVRWREGLATALPLPDASADAVVMSLLLHHLAPADKRTALGEARRVLRPGGALQIADWGRPRDPLMRAAFLLLQLLDGFEGTAPHARGELPRYLAEAGFAGVRVVERLRTVWGQLELLSARRG